MINIPDIGVRSIRIVQIPDVHSWTQVAPLNIPPAPPVTLEIGLPIINIPGCVEAHEQNNKSSTVFQDDSNGIKVFCDAGLPSYNPIDYSPEQLIYTTLPGTLIHQHLDPPKHLKSLANYPVLERVLSPLRPVTTKRNARKTARSNQKKLKKLSQTRS